MSRALRIAVYILFGLGLALLLTVWMFPWGSLERRIEAEAWQRYNVRVDLQGLGPALPLGCDFSRLAVSLPAEEGAKIEADRGSLRIKPWKLLAGDLGAAVELSVLGGEVSGEVELSPLTAFEEFEARLDWQAVRLERMPGIAKIRGARNIRGAASGRASLRGNLNRIMQARGEGRLSVGNSTLELDVPPAPVLPIQELSGEASWTLEERELAVEDLRCRAKGLRGGLRGTIRLHRPPRRSRLDLNGELSVSQGMPQAYSLLRKYMERTDFSFRIRGSLGRPKPTLLN